jgi:hypothetical protein
VKKHDNNNEPLHRRRTQQTDFCDRRASSGNLVEWFDFYVYAFYAIYFAPAFFPSDDPTVQLLNTGTVTDGKEWGRESELGYTVQSGSLKNLTVRLRNSSMRRDYSNNEFDENRLIVSYPISLL